MRVTTRDVGLAVRDGLEHLTHVTKWADDRPLGRSPIADVDVSDPDNIILQVESGETFVIRVIVQE